MVREAIVGELYLEEFNVTQQEKPTAETIIHKGPTLLILPEHTGQEMYSEYGQYLFIIFIDGLKPEVLLTRLHRRFSCMRGARNFPTILRKD